MQKDVLLNVESKEIRLAKLKGGQLIDLVIERKKNRQITGNIYRGTVTNILHNIQSAFIDIGENEKGFIHISDIIENTKKFEQLFDMDFDLDYDIQTVDVNKTQKNNIEEVLKPDQPVLVQVVKEPIGTKGARLTSNISVAGRYLVLLPNSPHRGVSRKIEDRATRDRLKKLIRAFEMPSDMGLICRTASGSATKDALIDEAHILLEQWEKVVEKFNGASGAQLLYEESDIVKRALMTCIDNNYDRLLIDDYPTLQATKRMYRNLAGDKAELKIEYYRDNTPMYERFNVESQIEKATRSKVWLNSGGYLFFDRTEAMYTIDVNSGRSSITDGNLEETLLSINLEAATEIASQLRLRNIGGLVICDFIDMRFRRNKRKVLDRLKQCMKDDPAKCTILGMSDFGLVEMTRQRNRESLVQMLFTHCPYCSGKGRIKTHETVSIELERALKKAVLDQEQFGLKITVHPELLHFIEKTDKSFLMKLAKKLEAVVEFEPQDTLHLNDFRFYSLTSGEQIEV